MFRRKRGLTSLITTTLIIASLIVAIGIIIVIIYNIVQSDIDVGEVSNIKLSIVEDSVKIDDDGGVSFNIERGIDGVDLTKIKFILSDKEKDEELIGFAEQLKESESKSFKVYSELFKQIKKISIIPIVKTKKGKEVSLSVSDSIELNYLGTEVKIQKINLICGNKKIESGEECDDGNLNNKDGCSSKCKLESCSEQNGFICEEGKVCSGNRIMQTNNPTEICCKDECSIPTKQKCSECGLMCAREECHSILEKCYFEGGWGNICTSCSLINCDKYLTQINCNEDRCLKNCEWNLTISKCQEKISIPSIICTNGACNSTYICSNNQWISHCGDGTCNCNENSTNCLADCPITLKSNGENCNLGTECSSGNCVDGYCCNSKCIETCKSCNITGNLGICTNNLYGTKLTGCNIDYQQCDGYGNCIDWKWVELPTYGYNYCAIYGLGDCADCYGSWKTCNPSLEGTTAWHSYIYGMLSPDFAGYINWVGNLTGSTNLCSHFLATNYPTGYNSSTFFSCSKIIVESVTEPS